MAELLIIEDEVDLLRTLTWRLEREGHSVRSTTSGHKGLAMARQRPPELLILDLMLPDLGGVAICRALRADPATADIAVLMVTARSEESDRVVGFEVGADDYVTKPFSPRELLLRIDAVLRRLGRDSETGALSAGPLLLDPSAYRVSVDGRLVELTPTEFSVLQVLMSHPDQLLTRAQLVDMVWGEAVAERTVDTSVKRIRRKLGEEAGALVETLRGAGYRFRGAGS